ncbi:MAG: ABC transporter permease, partial [Actinomycetia bacterium]|nr:ABC transporter permease [Actinomycetes bacterium]
MIIGVIAANSLRHLFRERLNLFFVFALPLLLIVVLGLSVAGARPTVGVVVGGESGPLAQDLIDRLVEADGVDTTLYQDREEATALLEREDLTALLIIPDDYDQVIEGGGVVSLDYVAIPVSSGFELQGIVESVVAGHNTDLRAARLLANTGSGDDTGSRIGFDEARTITAGVSASLSGIMVTTVNADGEPFIETDVVGFVAAQELVLFIFLISMTAASALVQVRRLGVIRRMLATPASTAEVVAGEALGRYGVAMLQSMFILGATAVLFGVGWGSWPASLAIVATFSLVATAAALLVGALVANENQSTAIGISSGMALAALGGCMVPFEIFPDGLRTFAHITPHAWAVDAFTEILQRGGGLGDIGIELGVLSLYGVGLLTFGVWALRRAIVG